MKSAPKAKPRRKPGGNAKHHFNRCEWCGTYFSCARPDAKTCSNAHRLQWTRWKRKHLAARKYPAILGPRGNVQWQQSPHRRPPADVVTGYLDHVPRMGHY